MIASVIVDIANSEVDRIFDYILPDELTHLTAGFRVLVPFGIRDTEGYITGLKETSDYDNSKLKKIKAALDPYPAILPEMLDVMEFMTRRYHLKKVDTLRLFIPSEMRRSRVKELFQAFVYINPEMLPHGGLTNISIDDVIPAKNKAQREIYEYLIECGRAPQAELNKNFSAAALRNLKDKGIVLTELSGVNRKPLKDMNAEPPKQIVLTEKQRAAADAVSGAGRQTFLLHGVTGSGKTEVYINCIQNAVGRGRTAIMLVPEISLTPQVFRIFRERFGEKVAILHSGLSAGERFDEWRRLLAGEAVIAIGARSAVFAPLKNVGLIIIDEEHDNSYISESNPRYFTHEVAEERARLNGCPLVLGSATPSIDSYTLAEDGEYKLLELPERINLRRLPDMNIVDMRQEIRQGNTSVFSKALTAELHKCVEGGNQAMIFINRRGHSSFVMCRACGYVAHCGSCDVSLVYHRDDETLKCHYCGGSYSMLDVCPECGDAHIRYGNVGTQRVEAELKAMFPKVKILRMDNDTTRTKDAHYNILNKFLRREAQILIGTQMIAKGHDFPFVTLVGLMDADLSLHFSDYRAAERTYQIVTQVSGRAGRDTLEGKVVLQTYSPKHYVYRFAAANDYAGFYKKEASIRRATKFPPYSRIVRILYSAEKESDIGDCIKPAYEKIKALAETEKAAFAFLNCMRCPMKRIQDKYRFQILMRIAGDSLDKITDSVYNIVDEAHGNKNVLCFVEINPQNLN